VNGHEFPRSLLLSMLMQTVPGRLDAIKAQLTSDPTDPITWPPTPTAWLLADRLPQREDFYPAVLVSSTMGRLEAAVQAGLGPTGVGDFVFRYDLTVGVAVVATRHGGENEASVGRDRLLLACREAVMLHPKLDDNARVIIRGLSETTGAAVEDLQTRAMSLGNLSISVEVTETLSDIAGTVDTATVGLHPHPGDIDDITPPIPSEES
jgi:hypothetical protein